MEPSSEIIKIQLKPGDTPARVLSVLSSFRGREIYCQLSTKFVLITELDFLKQLKKLLAEDIDKVVFVTEKSFFIEILEKQNLRVLADFPDALKDQPLSQIRDYTDRILATKNQSESPEPEASKTEAVATETGKPSPKQKAQFTKRRIENLAREKSWRGLVFFLFVGLITALLGLFFFITPRAEIVVKPRIDTIETTQNIIIALAGAEIPNQESNLPVVRAITVETEIADTETFGSTRREYEVTNARGKVTLYNEDETAKFLVPSRLATDEGLVFRTQSNHTIPGATEAGPGTLEVEVVADEYDALDRPIGDRGNIANGTGLIFPALREPLQALYYAKADRGPLVGGSTLTRYFVTEEDRELSQNVVEQSFQVRGVERLKAEIEQRSSREGNQYVLLDNSSLVRAERLEFNFPEELIGQERSTFEVSARYRIGSVVFSQSEVIDYLRQKLRLNQDHRKKIVEIDESTIDYRLLDTEPLAEAGWAKLSVSIVGVETIDFDADNALAQDWQESIKREVMGKDLAQARGILVNHPEVEEVLSLNIMPFWNKYIPTILDQINLKVRY